MTISVLPLRTDLPFPRIVDATMRSAFLSCPRKFYWEFLRAMRERRPNVDLHYGSCFARALEVARTLFYARHTSVDEAVGAGATALLQQWGDFPEEIEGVPSKSLSACMAAFGAYFETWPLQWDGMVPVVLPDGHLGVEMRLWANSGVEHPDGGPVYYAGRYDALLCDHALRAEHALRTPMFVCDEKTTRNMGSKWASQWKLRGQFMGYLWLTQQLGLPAQSALVRGICVRTNEIARVEVPVAPAQWQIDAWHQQMQYDIRRMIQVWRERLWPQDFADACQSYGGCRYLTLCESPDPDNWLEPDFEHRPWNPCEENEAVST